MVRRGPTRLTPGGLARADLIARPGADLPHSLLQENVTLKSERGCGASLSEETASMQYETNNGLLRALSRDDRELLWPALERVELQRGHVLESPGRSAGCAFFIETGLASVVAQSPDRSYCMGVVGNDGMTGLDILLDAQRSVNESMVQAAGSALRIDSEALRRAFSESSSLRSVLLRYVHVFMVQISQTALTNVRAGLVERLARWILMSHDRFQRDDLTVTHDFISLMLGVRRQGVTMSMHILEGEHLIKSTRDHIRVLDRGGLIAKAAGSYGVCEAEHERLIGPFAPRAGTLSSTG
jgi:CRP-like cAMP-binding protein